MTVSLCQSGHPHGIKTRSSLERVTGDFEIRVLMSDGGPPRGRMCPLGLDPLSSHRSALVRKGREGEPEKEMGNLQRR